jgi:cytoskeletal protein CcmA (bactofilin family)
MAEASDKDNPSFIQGAAPRTVLFANSSISGKLSYNLPVKIDGHFTGEIKSSELLVIGPNAQVEAHVSARQVHLEGKLIGSVQAMGCLNLKAVTSRVKLGSRNSSFTPMRCSKGRGIFLAAGSGCGHQS